MDQHEGVESNVSHKYALVSFNLWMMTLFYLVVVSGFDKDPRTSKFEIHVNVPIDTIKGYYSMNGKILLIPIFGTGKGEVILSKFPTYIYIYYVDF